MLALIDQFLAPSYLLWGGIAINKHPKEVRQDYHVDDEAGAPPRPPQGISTMWSIDDFTEVNGATEITPGSLCGDRARRRPTTTLGPSRQSCPRVRA